MEEENFMESVKSINDISSLNENKIIGSPNLENSTIFFNGSGNILYCENNVNLVNCNINFGGNNSLIYLSSSKFVYMLNIQIFQDSVIYIGKDNTINSNVSINVQEHQNVIIGDEGIIGGNTTIRTADAHIIYDNVSKKRINFSSGVIIGDHVWIGHESYICKGSHIGSGAIISNNSHVPSNSLVNSNTLYEGNPIKIIKHNIFFTKDYVGPFTDEDSCNFSEYTSRIYLFEEKAGETLDLDKIDELLSNFSIFDKIDFIQKLFIQSKKHNRFSI